MDKTENSREKKMELDFNRDWLLMKEDGSSCHVNLPHDAMIHEQRSFSNRNGDKTGNMSIRRNFRLIAEVRMSR